MIVNVVLMPDITRYARSATDGAIISITGNGFGGGAAIFLAMLPTLAFDEAPSLERMFRTWPLIVSSLDSP
jgi:hypothetical protein